MAPPTQVPASPEPDGDQATNCSEQMITTDDEAMIDFAASPTFPPAPLPLDCDPFHPTTIPRTLTSVRERQATPVRRLFSPQNALAGSNVHCHALSTGDESDPSRPGFEANGLEGTTSDSYEPIGGSNNQRTTSTLSLASCLYQAPPSYGTATQGGVPGRGQAHPLHQLDSGRLLEESGNSGGGGLFENNHYQQYSRPNQQQQQQQQQLICRLDGRGWPLTALEPLPADQEYPSAGALGGLMESQQQQQHHHLSLVTLAADEPRCGQLGTGLAVAASGSSNNGQQLGGGKTATDNNHGGCCDHNGTSAAPLADPMQACSTRHFRLGGPINHDSMPPHLAPLDRAVSWHRSSSPPVSRAINGGASGMGNALITQQQPTIDSSLAGCGGGGHSSRTGRQVWRHHRSTSGRSVSPTRLRPEMTAAPVGVEMASSSTQKAPPRAATYSTGWPTTRTDAPPTGNATLPHPHMAISAHCWLIDSSDELGGPSTSGARSQQSKYGTKNNDQLLRHASSVRVSPGHASFVAGWQASQSGAHLTLALAEQARRKLQQTTPEWAREQCASLPGQNQASGERNWRTGSSLGTVGSPGSRRQARTEAGLARLKTNSLKMERILSSHEARRRAESSRYLHHRKHQQLAGRRLSSDSALSSSSSSAGSSSCPNPRPSGSSVTVKQLDRKRPQPRQLIQQAQQRANSLHRNSDRSCPAARSSALTYFRLSSLVSLLSSAIRPATTRFAWSSSSSSMSKLRPRSRAKSENISTSSRNPKGAIATARSTTRSHLFESASNYGQPSYAAHSVGSSATSAYVTGSSGLSSSSRLMGGMASGLGRPLSTGSGSAHKRLPTTNYPIQEKPIAMSDLGCDTTMARAIIAGVTSGVNMAYCQTNGSTTVSNAKHDNSLHPEHSMIIPKSKLTSLNQQQESCLVTTEVSFVGPNQQTGRQSATSSPSDELGELPGDLDHHHHHHRQQPVNPTSDYELISSACESVAGRGGRWSRPRKELFSPDLERPLEPGSIPVPPPLSVTAAKFDRRQQMTQPKNWHQIDLRRNHLPRSSRLGQSSVASSHHAWYSIRRLLSRAISQPCPGSPGSSTVDVPTSGAGHDAARPAASVAAATRYQFLAPSKRRRRRGANTPSTIQRVLSLAKADRVFRCRLVASIIVTILLVALIGLLLALIKSRGGFAPFFRRQLLSSSHSLLTVDQSDYDLSWLWPPPNGYSEPVHLANRNHENVESMRSSSPLATESTLAAPVGESAPMRAQLLAIEQSERLDQLHKTVLRLTKLQLHRNQFLDVSQLAATKLTPADQDNNRTQPALGEAAHDLVSAALLSNLHWPLLKWRQQTQEQQQHLSVVHLFARAFSSRPTDDSSREPGDPGSLVQLPVGSAAQLRSLLGVLLLADSSQTATNQQGSNEQLRSFARLAHQLRSIARQVVSCSIVSSQTSDQNQQGRSNASHGLNYRHLSSSCRARFCRLLSTRYRRMMAALAALDNGHLAPLATGLPPDVGRTDRDFSAGMQDFSATGSAQTTSPRQQSLDPASSSRTMIAFLLDRLALLDERLLAEIVLADLADELDAVRSQPELADHLVEAALNHQDWTQTATPGRWSARGALLDLAKSLVVEDEHLAPSEVVEEIQQAAGSLPADLLHPWASERLPTMIAPLDYYLFIHPNLTRRSLVGLVKIDFRLTRPTRFLVIHSHPSLQVGQISLHLRQSTIGNGQNSTDAGGSTRSLPVRRTLANGDQLYIELHDLLEASSPSAPRSLAPDPSSVPIDSGELGGAEIPPLSVNFGSELPRLRPTDPANFDTTSDTELIYLLSLTFNRSHVSQADLETGHESIRGALEWVQYADTMAQLGESEVKTMLVSHLETSNARQVFPCLDEAHLKARFQLNLVHEHQQQVLFNGPKQERVPYSSDGFIQMSVFEPLPVPISPDQVSFVVYETASFKSFGARMSRRQLPVDGQDRSYENDNNGLISNEPLQDQQQQQPYVQVQVVALADVAQVGGAEWVSQLIPKLLSIFESHLHLAFPLDKIDVVAVPSESSLVAGWWDGSLPVPNVGRQAAENSENQLGGTSNPGLIWFRASSSSSWSSLGAIGGGGGYTTSGTARSSQQSDASNQQHLAADNANVLLADPNLINQELLEQSSLLVARQLAWQYFGSLVSPSHWQDRWLYEGLCQYLQSFVLRLGEPDWRLDEQPSVASVRHSLLQMAADQHQTGSWSPSPPATSEASATQLDQSQPDDSGNRQTAGERTPTTSGVAKRQASSPAAVLHMLMLNLLPSSEARARLLRGCLGHFRFGTMSTGQFWRQFGAQLVTERSLERLSLDLGQLPVAGESPNVAHLGNSPRQSGAEQRHPLAQPVGRLSDNIDRVAEAWLSRDSFPLVTVSVYRDRVHLRQEPFSSAWLTEPDLDTGASTNGCENCDEQQHRNNQTVQQPTGSWPIPLMFLSRLNPRQPRFIWLDRPEMELSFGEHSVMMLLDPSSAGPERIGSRQSSTGSLVGAISGSSSPSSTHQAAWFKLNVNQSSLVRVNYDERNWEALTDLMAKSHYSNHILNPLDRANLLDDALSLMRAGRLAVGVAMNLTLYLEVSERDYAPWLVALEHLDQMQALLNQNPLWHCYVLKLIQPISSIIGWKDDGPHLMRKLRRHLFALALQYGDDRTVSKARQEFKGWWKNSRFVVPNLAELVYVAGVRYGDQEEWFHCWQKYQALVQPHPLTGSESSGGIRGSIRTANLSLGASHAPSDPGSELEQSQLLTALASTHNTWLLEQFFNYSLDPTKVQVHHLTHVVETLGKNSVARLYLWRFVRLNWATLVEKFAVRHQEVLETMVLQSTKHFATRLDLDEASAFFKVKRAAASGPEVATSWPEALEGAIERALATIRSNIYWRDRQEPKLTKWLSHFDNTNQCHHL